MAAGGTPFDPAAYSRYIELLDEDLDQVVVLCDRAEGIDYVQSAKFDLLRQGGCGPGEFVLNRRFPGNDLGTITIGQYIRCRYTEEDDPVYLGRIEEVRDDSISGVHIRTDGPFAALNDIQVGGFDSEDLRLPDLYAASESVFIYDPDFNIQLYTFANNIPDLLALLFTTYIATKTNIGLGTIGTFSSTTPYNSSVFRGQENLSQIIRTLAVQQSSASYGVDANNDFFFIPLDETEVHTFQEGLHLTKLSRNIDRSLLYNRLIITGDYVYLLNQDQRMYRWVSAHASLSSINLYGSRKLVLYIPWVRTWDDAEYFAQGFFDQYAEPHQRYTATTLPQGAILNPWEGFVGILNRTGGNLKRNVNFDRCQVEFNQAPFFSFTTGPEDLQFPVAPEPNRWELQGNGQEASFSFPETFSFSSSGGSSSSASDGSDTSNPCFNRIECINVLADVEIECVDGNLVVTPTYVCVKRCG